MNLTILEKITRQSLKGHRLAESAMLSTVERRAISTLSWQTVPVANRGASTQALAVSPLTVWI